MTERNETDDETAILTRLQDPIEARALRAFLESEGIAVATPGLEHRSLLGLAGGYVEIVVRVPHGDRARAEELLATFRAKPEVSPTDDERPEDRARTDRLRRIAVFAACTITFGGGHFYARRWRTGGVLLAIEVFALILAFAWPAYWYALLGVIAADALGSVLLIGADQRGEQPSVLANAAPLLAIVAIAVIGLSRIAVPGLYAGRDMLAACARASECEGPETVAACVDRAAGLTFVGLRDGARERACAECLDESLCEDLRFDCPECAGLVSLPTPSSPVDRTRGPVGTSPEDMQIVIPQLFDDRRSDPAP